jgi:hypothetical protein
MRPDFARDRRRAGRLARHVERVAHVPAGASHLACFGRRQMPELIAVERFLREGHDRGRDCPHADGIGATVVEMRIVDATCELRVRAKAPWTTAARRADGE